METWNDLKAQIKLWSSCSISDDDFYTYLTMHDFELDADKRVVDLYIASHDGNEWSHAIYHRMR